MLHPGLYEQVINRALNGELSGIPEASKAVAPIDQAEASRVLAQYLADVVQKALDNVLDNGGMLASQVELTNQIVGLIQSATQESDFAAMSVDQRAEQLLALLRENDPSLAVGRTAADMTRPETSIAQSSLFTGAVHEPQMVTELKKEIVSADRIDMLVSFIDTGFTMAYVGSSNLSNAAISSGLEWNVKVTRKDLPETIDKIAATFESSWNADEFEYDSESQRERLARVLKAEKYFDRNGAELHTMDALRLKSDKDYSPTTMYNDYSISESLFHWQNQSTPAEQSPTGQRCIHHRERGSRPMNVTRKLDRPIPAKFLKKTNKLIAG